MIWQSLKTTILSSLLIWGVNYTNFWTITATQNSRRTLA